MRKMLFAATLLVTAACAPAAVQPTTNPTAESVSETSPSDALETSEEVATNRPAWHTMPLTNARTGETFTFADFEGKTIYVEPMATWCINCLNQQRTVVNVRSQLGDEEYLFLSLQIETNVTNEQLSQYADNNGFGWTFAVVTPEMLTELTNSFGRSITSPPSTPHFVIHPDGTTSALATGFHSADVLITELTTASEA
jgi:hypothetical protein